MSDLNEKIEERWNQRRKKGYNWPKLGAMVLALIAILYGMSMLKRTGNVVNAPAAEVTDSLATTGEKTP